MEGVPQIDQVEILPGGEALHLHSVQQTGVQLPAHGGFIKEGDADVLLHQMLDGVDVADLLHSGELGDAQSPLLQRIFQAGAVVDLHLPQDQLLGEQLLHCHLPARQRGAGTTHRQQMLPGEELPGIQVGVIIAVQIGQQDIAVQQLLQQDILVLHRHAEAHRLILRHTAAQNGREHKFTHGAGGAQKDLKRPVRRQHSLLDEPAFGGDLLGVAAQLLTPLGEGQGLAVVEKELALVHVLQIVDMLAYGRL